MLTMAKHWKSVNISPSINLFWYRWGMMWLMCLTMYDLCSMCSAKSEEKKMKIEIIRKLQIGSNTILNDLPKTDEIHLKVFLGNIQDVKDWGQTYFNYLVYLFISWHTSSSLSKNSIINVASVEVVPRKILIDVKTTIAVLGTSNHLLNGYIKGAIAKLCKQKKYLFTQIWRLKGKLKIFILYRFVMKIFFILSWKKCSMA